MRILILGGTSEASALVRRIAERRDLDPTLSLAGRTRNPTTPPIPFRIGGFGHIAGLRKYLIRTHTDLVIDATHPFAVRMSQHAATACGDLGLPLLVFTRPPWHRQAGDRWSSVGDIAAAVGALGDAPRTVFLTIGVQELSAFAAAPHHRYIVRSIDRHETIDRISPYRVILARGPFAVENEIALMRQEQIEVLVTKNSGGSATEAKLIAARALGIDVVMIERPASSVTPAFETVEAILARIEIHRPRP